MNRGLFKSRQAAKMIPIYSHFAGCSRVCTFEHMLSDSQYGRLFSQLFRLLQTLNTPLHGTWDN